MKLLKLLLVSACVAGLTACGGGSGDDKEESFTVNASVNEGGSVNATQTAVAKGNTTSFSFTPETGYHLKTVSGCNGTLSGVTYTTGAVTTDCTIKADFERNTHTVTANASAGGGFIIQNAAPAYGSATQVVAMPDAGYGVASFSGCGAGTTTYSVYTTAPITADCAVAVTFKKVISVEGVAAEGSALAGAEVSAKCSDGSTFTSKVTTDETGKFFGLVGENAFPCALKVTTSTPTKTYYSIANKSGTTNINLLTDMALILASGKSGAEWYASSDWSSVNNKLTTAQSSLKESFYKLGYTVPAGDFLPFTSTFTLAGVWDKLLDQIQAGIEKTPDMTYDSLIASLKSGDSNVVPAPTGGSEPTAEVCFNPVLYAEGATITTTYTVPTVTEGNTTWWGYENTYTTTNQKIIDENGVPILTRTSSSQYTNLYDNSFSKTVGEDKTFVDLAAKAVATISYTSKPVDDSNLPPEYQGNNFLATYKEKGYPTDYKVSTNAVRVEDFVYTGTSTVGGKTEISESTVRYTKTFKGLTTITNAGTDYRVCDFEVESAWTNQHSLTNGTSWDDSLSTYHDYILVGSGLGLTVDTDSIILNGQELLTGLPK